MTGVLTEQLQTPQLCRRRSFANAAVTAPIEAPMSNTTGASSEHQISSADSGLKIFPVPRIAENKGRRVHQRPQHQCPTR